MSRKLILITPGDPEGIGPEIVLKALRKRVSNQHTLICVGALGPFLNMGARFTVVSELDLVRRKAFRRGGKKELFILPAPERVPTARTFLPGYQSGWSVEKAAKLVLDGKADALVTGPISKERLQRGGYGFNGHTDFLAHLCRNRGNSLARGVTMMLANDALRVSLVTTHVALSKVSKQITRGKIRLAVMNTVEALKNYWKIQNPRIAVTALNPHAGESGIFGREEIETISPEIASLKKDSNRSFSIDGPFPADTLFARHIAAKPPYRFDAVVCMYHDQGLIPVKLLDFSKTVNVTLGLPIVRTSVDHGVGFDIVGKGIADPSSLLSAIELAAQLSRG